METPTTSTRTRLCSLCQQYYGSGLRDHIAASDILRSRRMLLDRSPANDPGVQQGLEQFLDEISKQRTRTDMKHQQLLSVCAFCTQFLPSMYQEDKLVDDLRHQLLTTGATHSHPIATTRRKASNLVIQHHLPKASSTRPQSSNSAAITPQPPSHPHTYRLLTDEMTRVLELDATTVRNSLVGQSNLMAGDVIKDLRHQERRQSTNILSARRAAHEAKLDAAIQNRHLRGEDLSLSSDILQDRTEKRNIVRAIATGSSSLYTGVVIHTPVSARRAGELTTATSVAAHAKVVVGRHGRHFKSELKFPSLLS